MGATVHLFCSGLAICLRYLLAVVAFPGSAILFISAATSTIFYAILGPDAG